MPLKRLLAAALLAACSAGPPAPDAPPPAPLPAPPPPAAARLDLPVAELREVRGRGVRTEDMAEGTSMDPGARLRRDQAVVVPSGALAELRLGAGARIFLREGARAGLVGPAELRLEAGELVARVEAGAPALTLQLGDDRLTLARGEARALRSDERRTYDVLEGTATLRRGGAAVELGPGARLDVPAGGDLPAPALGLDALADSAWTRAFEVAHATLERVPAGVGSLSARRAGEATTSMRLALAEQHVRVTISGRLARTEVEQTFANPTGDVLEGTYRFPLPTDASISGLSLRVGDAWMNAEVLEKRRAREIFRAIVDATIPRDPALLEWERGSTFSLKIFPIPARGSRKVRLSYTQVLPAVGDVLRYRYPLAGGGAAGEAIGAFSFTLSIDRADLAAGAPVRTPMLHLEPRELPDRLELAAHLTDFRPVHDLGVDLPLAPDARRQRADTFQDRDGQAYFMLALRPRLPAPERRPTHLAFVLDRSHSTTPERWTLARGLVRAAAAGLAPDDRMTVLACDAACDLAPGGLAAPADAAARAETFLGGQVLDGASDLGAMIRAAADALAPEGVPPDPAVERVVVYLGDGAPTAGELAPDELLRRLAGPLARVRVEALALGAGADLLVLEALTRASGGDLLRADLTDDLDALARELRLRAALPPHRDLELLLPPGLGAVHPRRPGALRGGDTLVLVGKLERPVRGALELRATSPSGQVITDRFELDLAAAPGAARGRSADLPRTWARHEIDALTALQGHAARAAIVALSRRHHVLSRYTALIALESEAMYREFGVARDPGSQRGWDGRLGDPAEPDALDRAETGAGGGGVGSGYGSSGGYSGGYGGRDRSVPVWTLHPSSSPRPEDLAAVEALRQAAQGDPTRRSARRRLVQQAIRRGDPGALQDAIAWAQVDPDHAPAQLARADMLAAAGDPRALRALGSVVEVDPWNLRRQTALAEALASKGDFLRSCAHRRALVSIDPRRPEHHLELARCYLELARPELARAAAEEGIARTRATPDLRAAAAGVLERSGPLMRGELEAHLSWSGDSDLDLAFIDERGRRLSALRREGLVQIVQTGAGEHAALAIAAPQRVYVEVTRASGEDPVRGELSLSVPGTQRTFPVELERGSLRVARVELELRSASPEVRMLSERARVEGGLGLDVVRRIVRAHINEARYCYFRALQHDSTLAGRVTLRFVITPEGQVSASSVRDATLVHPDVTGCLVNAARRWTFPRPSDAGFVTVTFPLVFSPIGSR